MSISSSEPEASAADWRAIVSLVVVRSRYLFVVPTSAGSAFRKNGPSQHTSVGGPPNMLRQCMLRVFDMDNFLDAIDESEVLAEVLDMLVELSESLLDNICVFCYTPG